MFTGSFALFQEETNLTEHPRLPRHPEFEAEQAYIEGAYRRLEEIRAEATERAERHAAERPTSFQAVYERDVAVRVAYERARSLDIGDQSLVFGRIDREDGERYYIGRRAVFDPEYRPLVIDWRVPAAEPFYRATGKHPMGLEMRRHFLCDRRVLLSVEDERFAHGEDIGLAGSGALIAAMEAPRTGRMRDIVATVQAEQDEVIRDDLGGVLIVQGGPGTGKTAVGLHRAAYLLFTHRRKLERQGILVVGPNRRFLRYIDQVLPALGETGVFLATLANLAPGVTIRGEDPDAIARLKGDARMARLIREAMRLRQRHPGQGISITFEGVQIDLSAREVRKLVTKARRNRRSHNARRAMLLSILVFRLYRRYWLALKKQHGALAEEMRLTRARGSAMLREHDAVQALIEEAWPLMSPQRLVGELLSSRAHLTEAAKGVLDAEEIDLLVRDDADAWTSSDLPLLDEAAALLGVPQDRRRVASLEDDDTDDIEVYGHIIVDEAQDLTPMALRMIARRSMTGSLTLVGDLAQAVGATPPRTWDDVLEFLPNRDGQRTRQLTINYRTPGPIMSTAARVLAAVAPDLTPPRSAREDGEPIAFIAGDPTATVVETVSAHRARGAGTLAVIAARADVDALRSAADVDEADEMIAVLNVHEAKGLEFDRVVVVEPSRIVSTSSQGLRALYVALTRATQHVTVAYAGELPEVLAASRTSD